MTEWRYSSTILNFGTIWRALSAERGTITIRKEAWWAPQPVWMLWRK
jgi:hypothetical protein